MKDIHGAAGLACIELTLPLMLTAVRWKTTMQRMVELLCENPAKTFGLWPRKGSIRVGGDADYVVVDIDRELQ